MSVRVPVVTVHTPAVPTTLPVPERTHDESAGLNPVPLMLTAVDGEPELGVRLIVAAAAVTVNEVEA